MGRSVMSFCFAAIALFSSLAFGLFEEQAGEYDWKIESIGAIQQSFNKDGKTFVATADSVIASLNSNDGKLKWRVSLPPGTSIHNIISGKAPSGSTDIFSLTSIKVDSADPLSNEYQFLLSSWSAEVGTLRWQLSLGSKQLGLTDLVYDSSRYLITCLSGNSIDAATVRGHLIWHWSPSTSDDAQLLSNSGHGKELIITQLMYQKSIQKIAEDSISPSRIAVGCFVDSAAQESNYYSSSPSSLISFDQKKSGSALSKCGNTVVVSVVLPTKLVAQSAATNQLPNFILKVFQPLPEVSVGSLRAVMSTDDSTPYSANDMLFGFSASQGNKPRAFSLNLNSNAATAYEVPTAHVTMPTSGASFLISTKGDELIPTVVFCFELSCSSFYLTNNDQKNKSVYQLAALSECVGSGSTLGIERLPSGGSIAEALTCAVASLPKTVEDSESEDGVCSISGCSAGENTLSVTSSTVGASGVSHASLTVALPSNAVPNAVLYVGTYATEAALSAVIVYSSLHTVSYTAPLGPVSSGKAVWLREESLSRVRQAVIVEDSRSYIHKKGETDSDAPPSFTERIGMQLEDLKQTILDLEGSLTSLPSILYAHSVTGFGMFPAPSGPSRFQEAEAEVGLGIDSAAEKRRKVKSELFPHKDRVKKARLFGFNKIAVTLSSSLSDLGGGSKVPESRPSNGPMEQQRDSGFLGAGLKLAGLDLLSGEVIWTLDPTLESGQLLSTGSEDCVAECEAVTMARLVTVHSSPMGAEVMLLASVRSGATYAWHVDASSGESAPHPSSSPDAFKGPMVGVLSLQRGGDHHKGTTQYLLLNSHADTISASVYPPIPHTPAHNASAGHVLPGTYAHNLDVERGTLTTYQISADHTGVAVSRSKFPGPLASVSYPYSDDVIDSRYTVIGDQSILMKYANPHTVLLTYFSSARGSQQSEAPSKDVGESLYAALVDTVSNKVLYRILLSKSASKPVHTLLVENHVIVTYWNAKAKRTELSSSALYEGMVDVFGLSPLSSFSALPQQIRDADHSSFTSPLPLGIQRTYVIPRMVTSLHHTVTSRGMAHKNILIGFSGGQLFSIDHRMIHPRRPLGTPTNSEKEEGLSQYNPFIPIIPQHAVTQDARVAGEALHVVTAPVRLESTSLVLVYGGLDVFFSRVSPSQGFDVLASDFNHPLLILLLVLLAFGVYALKRIHVAKTLKQSWA